MSRLQIPGHHFPPLILGSLVVYLTCILTYPETTQLPDPPRFLQASEPWPNGGESPQKGLLTPDHDGEAVGSASKGVAPARPSEARSTDSKSKVLISGIPDWHLKGWSFVTIVLNVILALFVLDMVLRGPVFYPSNDLRFSRVGHVDTTSAKVLFREPDPAQLPVYAYIQKDGHAGWTIRDRIYSLGADTDYTYPISFTNLHPLSTYTYSLSNNLSGTFTTAPAPRSPAVGKLSFLTSSCIKANFPYNPFSHALSIPGFTHLSNILRSLPAPPAFMLFLGDFIYVDVPLRLSSSTRHYRSEHRRVYASPSWSLPGLASLPWIHTLDDHEIANDWSAGNATPPFPSARDPFLHYHVSVNPPTPPFTPLPPETTFFTFTRGPASFFLLDTRAYRTAPNLPNSTILGSTQLNSLLKYLSTPEPSYVHWKIVASSVPFTKNWRVGASDCWAGFLAERRIVLDSMQAAERRLGVRVVILSGDRHEFGAVHFPPNTTSTDPSATASPPSGPHEFSVGPLSMFYLPFRTFKQVDGEDVPIKYIPEGNAKVGKVEIENLERSGRQKSLLRYTLYVDGKPTWKYVLTSPAPEFKGRRGGIWDVLWG